MPATASETLMDTLRAPGGSAISIEKLAEMLEMQVQTFAEAAGVHRDTLRLNSETDTVQALQAFARDVVRVIQAAIDLGNDRQTAIHHVKHSPIRAFDYKTALELVEAGRADDVVGYLQSLSAGYVG